MVRYFFPKNEGDSVVGIIDRWDQDKYGNSIIVLNTEMFDGIEEPIRLPGHQFIKEKTENAYPGDYFSITFTGFKDSTEFNVKKYQYYISRIPRKQYGKLLDNLDTEQEYDQFMKRLGAKFTQREILERRKKSYEIRKKSYFND